MMMLKTKIKYIKKCRINIYKFPNKLHMIAYKMFKIYKM